MVAAEDRKANLWFVALFALFTCAQAAAIALSPLGLAPDEAHYWEWSRRLDLSYYSKGPLVAVLIRMSTSLLGDTQFAVRLPALVCFSLFSLVFYLFIQRIYSSRAALVSWIALRSTLMFVQMGVVMTTDAPAALFWLLALVCAYAAAIEEWRWSWLLVGLFIGLGFLAKYTVILLYAGLLLTLFLCPMLRSHLRSWQLYAGVAICAFVISPVLWWNAQHGWVNFAHNAGHVVRDSGFAIRPGYFLELLGGQLGLVGPLLFVGLCLALWDGWKAFREGDARAGFFLWSSAPLIVLTVGVSWWKRVYANWPLPIYIGALALLVHIVLLRKRGVLTRFQGLIKPAIALNLALTVLAHLPFLGVTLGVSGKYLTTKKLVGWQELGTTVDAALGSSGRFVLADDYEVASEIAFYTPSRPRVYCDYLDDRRMNQYDIWQGLQHEGGKDAIIVLKDPNKITQLASRFASIEPVLPHPSLAVRYSNSALSSFYLFRGNRYDGSLPAIPARR